MKQIIADTWSMWKMREKIRARIMAALEGAGLVGLTTAEVAHRAETTRNTASDYLRALASEGIVISIPKPPVNLHILKKSVGVLA